MLLHEIFKVIYSPVRAFKEIAQNPKYAGPVLVMILFMAASTGFVYVALTKTFVERTLPTFLQRDEWTENMTLWESNAYISESSDYVSGTYYGNRSIEFSMQNRSQVYMQLDNMEPVNCSGAEGYREISFRMKLIRQDTVKLKDASLLFYSGPEDYFYYNLTGHLGSINGSVWNNVTIPVGSESASWQGSTNAHWSNITGLRFELEWPEKINATVRIDGLLFRGSFKSELENATGHMLNYSLISFMQFTLKWVILSGILYVMSKALGAKAVWRPILILVGFALITLFVQAVINTATYASVQKEVYYPIEYFSDIKGEFETAYNKILKETWLASQIGQYVQVGVYVWTIALCALALRLLVEFSWAKSFLVSTVAYFASLMVEGLLMG